MSFAHRGRHIPAAPGKDPGDNIDYVADWTRFLDDGETLSSSSWIVQEGISVSSTHLNSPFATVWLRGGDAGVTYRITNRVITSGGRTAERSMNVRCFEQ